MSIRIRDIDGELVALCAAKSEPRLDDIYLSDREHHALYEKFYSDFESEGLIRKRRFMPAFVKTIDDKCLPDKSLIKLAPGE